MRKPSSMSDADWREYLKRLWRYKKTGKLPPKPKPEDKKD
jgi:hypothetical protein